MVGQRLRVWPARLTRRLNRRSVLWGSVALVLLATCGTLVLRRLASDWLGDSTTDVGIRPGTRPADAPSNNSANNSPNNSPSNSAGSPAPTDPDSVHPLDSVLRIAKVSMETHKRNHRDFRAMVRKRERIGKELGPESRMEIKLRYRDEDPQTGQRRMDVYLKFIEPKSQAGREVIWQEGLNDGLMVVHEAGFLNITRLELSPTSKLAMLGNRYPISDIGIERLLAKLLFKGNRDRGLGDCLVSLTDSVQVAGRDCKRIEVCHPEPEAIVGDRSIPHEFYKAIIDIDSEHGVPIRYASYMWPEKSGGEPVLDEEFIYEQLELNAQLADKDFDPDNPAYNYP